MTDGGLFARFGAMLSGGLQRHCGVVRKKADDERAWETRMKARLAGHWPEDEDWPDDEHPPSPLHRRGDSRPCDPPGWCDGSRAKSRPSTAHATSGACGPATARLATELVLDETAAASTCTCSCAPSSAPPTRTSASASWQPCSRRRRRRDRNLRRDRGSQTDRAWPAALAPALHRGQAVGARPAARHLSQLPTR